MLENLTPAKKVEMPADFRAALTFDGEFGEATLPAGQSDWGQFLIDQGFDPSEYEIVGNPRTSRWQKYDGDWLTSYRFSFRKLIKSDKDLKLTWANARKNAKIPANAQKNANYGKALVVMLADFQIGKADHRGGLDTQLQRLFTAFDALETKFKAGKYQKIILADMGDIVEGFSNKADMQQLATNQASIMDQVDISTSLIWDIIKRANKYSEVTYATVASNHCQNRINKQQVGQPGNDDWGIFIAKQIHRLSEETGLEVNVLIPQPSDESLALDVFEDNFHILGLWHGHQYARPDSALSWWSKQAFGKQPVSAATIGLSGHFHHLRIEEAGSGRYWIQGKTMDNGSNWFRLNQGNDSSPGITCFELLQGVEFKGSVINV